MALEGLRAAGADLQAPTISAIAALSHFQREDGSFGSLIPGGLAGPTKNSSARHTACALLLLLEFAEGELRPRIEPVARWLASPAVQLRDGGWPYEDRDKARGFAAMTTAAAIAALCQFLATSPPTDRRLKRSARTAVRRGCAALFSRCEAGTWDCEAEGGTADTQVGDSGLILWFIGRALRHGLGDIVREIPTELPRCTREFMALGLPNGWPSRVGARDEGLSSTILGLWAVLDAPQALDHSSSEQELIVNGLRTVAARLMEDQPGAAAELRTYDWAVTSKLGALAAGPMSKRERVRLQEIVARVRRAAEGERLSKTELESLSPVCRRPIFFALTRGAQTWSGPLETWFQSKSALRQGLIVAVVGALLSVMLTFPFWRAIGRLSMSLVRAAASAADSWL